VGIGARAARAEILDLMTRSQSSVLVMHAHHRDLEAAELARYLIAESLALSALIIVGAHGIARVLRVHDGVLVESGPEWVSAEMLGSRALGPNELSMLNSTSGTTGKPKLVTQFANRWINFSDIAIAAGELNADDVFMGAVPGPFGFGLWTAHYAPTMLGVPTVLLPIFSVDEMIRMIEQEKVTILACVSTQFKMMLNSPLLETADLRSLRVMFTGGEAVPFERALQFEKLTGATVLQFYGSNEGGALSCTSLTDSAEQRLRTAGRVVPNMNVRLYDQEGRDITATGGPGQPAAVGPTSCIGYFNDAEANAELFRGEHLMMPDIVTIDDDGYLTVVGRASDLIIRGGKNISATEVEALVEGHPGVVMAAAVPYPDEIFGERIGVAVQLLPGQPALSTPELSAYLSARCASKHVHPECVVVVDELPQAPGGKVAKGSVRALLEQAGGVDRDLRLASVPVVSQP